MFSKKRDYFLIRKQTFHHACISGEEIGGENTSLASRPGAYDMTEMPNAAAALSRENDRIIPGRRVKLKYKAGDFNH
jgi:hypothetical protein